MKFGQKRGGKIPGKTLYALPRRKVTRTSGFSVHEDTSGGEFRRHNEEIYSLAKGEKIEVKFQINCPKIGDILGFGLWFWCTNGIEVQLINFKKQYTLTNFDSQSWNKAGSIWRSRVSAPIDIHFILKATEAGQVALYNPLCGRVVHKHYEGAPEKLMKNMFETAPEAIFVDGEDTIIEKILPDSSGAEKHEIILKSCNRCGRYLPINIGGENGQNERNHLSFTNHCVAAHRLPCSHTNFGMLRNIDDPNDIINLNYGFQLECRFCKKFEVNAAHNPQRSPGQMKEDGARRRAFELLLRELYEGSAQMLYRHHFKSELADDIWKKFDRKCFNCSTTLPTARAMHLDHTRPLAYLWPLDETATALCKSCNSLKRDRMPSEFYIKPGQIELLAKITNIPLHELSDPKPNEKALEMILDRKEWLFSTFLMREEMVKERDGKITGEIVVKSLQRALVKSPTYKTVDLQAEYEARRTQYLIKKNILENPPEL
ncbi:hypothetical protein NQF86_08375 [Bombella sp. TMW 2.2543]|uniref:HNH endonuclease n=1 Tax=Bombella pluederhausensis TaxID=2967336 RepID=A0ABT3WM01_9PROT|nr:hypothetical protein [Bombella pluederhausensis]MCX5618673.1 hypothetical protein [Bombella pluederhausensis]